MCVCACAREREREREREWCVCVWQHLPAINRSCGWPQVKRKVTCSRRPQDFHSHQDRPGWLDSSTVSFWDHASCCFAERSNKRISPAKNSKWDWCIDCASMRFLRGSIQTAAQWSREIDAWQITGLVVQRERESRGKNPVMFPPDIGLQPTVSADDQGRCMCLPDWNARAGGVGWMGGW